MGKSSLQQPERKPIIEKQQFKLKKKRVKLPEHLDPSSNGDVKIVKQRDQEDGEQEKHSVKLPDSDNC